jgi:predicted RNA-binding Zn-ribbon protein involved in translation (DUF1610 family)
MAREASVSTISDAESRPFRQLRRITLIGMVGFIGSWVVLTRMPHHQFSIACLMVVFAVLCAVASTYMSLWNCPRCGLRFMRRQWYERESIFRSQCAHCGARFLSRL